MKTVQLRITGKVQGVWYRASAKDKAISLSLTGKVWNEPNGDVSAIIQGDDDSLSAFIEWCKVGPPLARVDDVEVMTLTDNELFNSFEIAKG